MHQDIIATFERLGVRDVEVTADVDKAVARVTAIYEAAVERLHSALHQFSHAGITPGPIDAFYPFVGIVLGAGNLNLDGRIAYGALHDPGVYGATLTDPRLFGDYYRTQLGLLLRNHAVPLATGISDRPIPLPFVVDEIGSGLTRDPDADSSFTLQAEEESLTLTLPKGWMDEHYLRASELRLEMERQQKMGWPTRVQEA